MSSCNISIFGVECALKGMEVHRRGFAPPKDALEYFRQIYEKFMTPWRIFVSGVKPPLNPIICSWIAELLPKTNNLVCPYFVGVWCNMVMVRYYTCTATIVLSPICVGSMYMNSLWYYQRTKFRFLVKILQHRNFGANLRVLGQFYPLYIWP